jgi:hypothetical protein
MKSRKFPHFHLPEICRSAHMHQGEFMKLLIAFLFVTLAACSHDNGSNNTDTITVNPDPNSLLKDVTDHSTCQGVTGSKPTAIGTWKQSLAGPDFDMDVTMMIGANFTVANYICTFKDGTKVGLEFTVPSTLVDNQFTIVEPNENASEIENNGKTYKCHASLAAGARTVTFAGACLGLNENGSQLYMIQ